MNSWSNMAAPTSPDARGRTVRRYLTWAILLFIAACDRVKCDETTQVEPSLSVNSAGVTVGQGQEITETIAIVRGGGMTDPVTLRTTGAVPAGVSVTFAPATIPSTERTTQLTVRVAQSVAATAIGSSIQIPFEATGGGLTSTGTISIGVLSSQAPAVTLQLTPTVLPLLTGATGNIVVKATRLGGFTGPLTFSILGITPNDLDVTMLAGNSADERILRVTAPGAVQQQQDSYGVQVQVVGTQSVFAITTAQVIVTQPSGLALQLPDKGDTSRTLFAGVQDTVTVLLVRQGAFTGAVTLSAELLPTGITASFSPSPTTSRGSIMTFAAASSLAPGNYPFRIRGVPAAGSGIPDALMTFVVRVVDRPPSGTFSISAPNVTVAQGASATSLLTIGRSADFNASIGATVSTTSTVSNRPTVTVTSPVTSGNGLLSIATAANTPPGVYSYRVDAYARTSTGAATSPTATTDFTVTVAPPRTATTIAIRKLVGGLPQATTGESLVPNGSVALLAEIRDQDGQLLNTGVTWTTSNSAIATVDSSGVVRGVAAGIADVSVRPVINPTNIVASLRITVAPPPSLVTRIEIEPQNAEITAPATQQFRATLYNAAGAVVTAEAGGAVRFSSSNAAVASIDSTSGVATGKAAGIPVITARYVVNGNVVVQSSTPLTVYVAGSVGHYGSAEISTNGGVRTIRRGESVVFQLIVRNTAGTQVQTGVTPAPTVTSSNAAIVIAQTAPPTGAPAGYYYTMTASASAPLGTSVAIRYDVMGAGGAITIVVVP